MRLTHLGVAVLLAAAPSFGIAQVAGDLGTFDCRAVQVDVQDAVASGMPYKNKGKLVAAAATATDAALDSTTITEACADCIVTEFGEGIPIADQEACGPDAVCGDGLCTAGETFYGCPVDCGGHDVIAQSTVRIPRSDKCGNVAGRTCESLVGDVVADAMRGTYAVDFAIVNSGGLRADLTCPGGAASGFCPANAPPPYLIARGSVFEVMPFQNKVVTLTVTGAELKVMLENAVSRMPTADGRFPQVSGLCFTYDISAAAGSRVTSAIRQAANGSCTGLPVDLTAGASYAIAENDFMATGGDGYPDFSGRYTVREILDQVVADHVHSQSPISPSLQGRIVCTSSGATPCPVGVSTVAVPRDDSCGRYDGRLCESLVGNVVTDALRAAYGADFAITNAGGLRASLTCPTAGGADCPAYTPPPYPITRGQVLAVLPFGNAAVTVDITGAELKAMLENAVSLMPAAVGRFPQVSGLCFTYDISAAVGSRVTSAIRQAANGSCSGLPIDLTAGASYTIVENDFMAAGGDGYPNFTGRYTAHEPMDQVVTEYVRAQTPISPVIQGRIACTTSGLTACPVVVP